MLLSPHTQSSLLNALLDEAAVLPTSGSRGCTAAVVELRSNCELSKVKDDNEVDVYRGYVEFMTRQEWDSELRVLLDECCTNDAAQSKVYARPPEEQNQPDAAAAWSKINQVYGAETMARFCGRPKAYAWSRLSQDGRVVRLLTPPEGATCNIIEVKEGLVGAADAKRLMAPLSRLKGKLRRSQKKWARNFRVSGFILRLTSILSLNILLIRDFMIFRPKSMTMFTERATVNKRKRGP